MVFFISCGWILKRVLELSMERQFGGCIDMGFSRDHGRNCSSDFFFTLILSGLCFGVHFCVSSFLRS